MKKKITISIIIPYFKKKDHFKKTIQSIIIQSFKNYEVIVVYDDNDSKELVFVKNILSNIKNKKILFNKKNLGPGKSRNKGILVSKGDYIAFCDADDIWKKNKLSKQLLFMKKNKLNFSHSSYSIINKNSKKIGKFKIKKYLNYEDLIKSCDIGLSTVMIKKKILLKYKFCALKTKEDYQLWLRIMKNEKLFQGISDSLSSWRKVEGSLSSSLIQKLLDSFRLFYIYEKHNFIISILYVLRLTYFALIKKINIFILKD
jgi:teichuronic acid biosynthesis glycosyltransferase TuaG